jgi:hypothetical protein
VREELGRELLDPGASRAFAVADHQVAHVYVKDAARTAEVRALVERVPGVDRVLGPDEKAECRINHSRAGELIAVAAPDAWFTYYYWLDDQRAPDFARTVDIHRKPGYDPVELVIDPAIGMPAVNVGWKLFKRSLGFRTLLDVIPLDATLVHGSHGRQDISGDEGPLIMSKEVRLVTRERVASTDVAGLILKHLRSTTPA